MPGIFESLGVPEEYSNLGSAITKMQEMAEAMNKVFGQTRQRMDELQVSVADAAPAILKLGGNYQDVLTTIQSVSEATKTNVIASTESISKLYAATKLIDIGYGGVERLVKNFSDVGVNFTRVGKQLEDSMEYTRSIGVNTKQVMRDVVNNTEKLNRFNFEDGVKGLTKMAAQAAMLRTDMSTAFQLADKVMDPQGAIEVASAFQRLGVAAGTLVDPFALMNSSINDPQGLQTSLAKVAEQYTYFDEKTKTFKINPQGVLMLKEIESQTGVSAREMSKMGLASKELTDKLSQMRFEVPEESKQYLANIATMNEAGDWVVKVKDERGKDVEKKLSEVTEGQFKNLIKEQKDQPKTAEEIARKQMGLQETISSNVASIAAAATMGVASTSEVRQGYDAIQSAVRGALGTAGDELGKTGLFRDQVEKEAGKLKEMMEEATKTGDFKSAFQKYADSLDKTNEKVNEKLLDIAKKATTNIEKEMKYSRGGVAKAAKETGIPLMKKTLGIKDDETKMITTKNDVNFGGTINFNVTSSDNVSKSTLDNLFKSKDFNDKLITVFKQWAVEQGLMKSK